VLAAGAAAVVAGGALYASHRHQVAARVPAPAARQADDALPAGGGDAA
jgi:hypothetical protein